MNYVVFSTEHPNNRALMTKMTKLFNAAHFFQVEPLMTEITKFVQSPEFPSLATNVSNVLYAACRVVDHEDKGKPILRGAQEFLNVYFLDQGIDPYDVAQAVFLRRVNVDDVAKVFNNYTVEPKTNVKWLRLLCDVSTISSSHAESAKKVLLSIDHKKIDATLIADMYNKGYPLITKDVVVQLFLKLATDDQQQFCPSLDHNKNKRPLNSADSEVVNNNNSTNGSFSGSSSSNIQQGKNKRRRVMEDVHEVEGHQIKDDNQTNKGSNNFGLFLKKWGIDYFSK